MVVEKASQPPPADASGDAAAAAGNKKKPLSKKDAAAKEAEAELSEEDQELKEKLDLCVQRLSEVGDKPDNAAALAPAAVRSLAEEVRTSTTSMTSVPKPLKFLRPHYASLCASQEKLSAIGGASSEEAAQELADVLSVLAISSGARGGREALKWRLKGKQVRREEIDCWSRRGWEGGGKEKLMASETIDAFSDEKNKTIARAAAATTTRSSSQPRLCFISHSLLPYYSSYHPPQQHQGPVGAWGHEYVRTLAGEIGDEWAARRENAAEAAAQKDAAAEAGTTTTEAEAKTTPPSLTTTDDLLVLVNQIVPYHLEHNAEPEAVDLLLEVERLDLLPDLVDARCAGRTCLYRTSCAPYLPEPDDGAALRAARLCYAKVGRHFDALRVALQLGDVDMAAEAFAAASDPSEKKQLAHLLARAGVVLEFEEGPAAIADDALREAVSEAASNSRAPQHFLALAKDLDVLEPRSPENPIQTLIWFGSRFPSSRGRSSSSSSSSRTGLSHR